MAGIFAKYTGQGSGGGSGGVSSLDGLTGALTLVAGSGITITNGLTTITIASTSAGDVTLTAFGSSPNANAASLSGQALTLQPASLSFPGGVSTGTQTFAGAKTIVADSAQGQLTLQASTTALNGGALQFLNPAASGLYNFRIASNVSNGRLSFTPSTAADSTTYGSPVLNITRTGVVEVPDPNILDLQNTSTAMIFSGNGNIGDNGTQNPTTIYIGTTAQSGVVNLKNGGGGFVAVNALGGTALEFQIGGNGQARFDTNGGLFMESTRGVMAESDDNLNYLGANGYAPISPFYREQNRFSSAFIARNMIIGQGKPDGRLSIGKMSGNGGTLIIQQGDDVVLQTSLIKTTANAATTIDFVNAGQDPHLSYDVGIGDGLELDSTAPTEGEVTQVVSETELIVDTPLGNGTLSAAAIRKGMFLVLDRTSARVFFIDKDSNVIVGNNTAQLATAANNGFMYLSSTGGTPTGTPKVRTGSVPLVVDESGSKLWAYIGGTWKSTTFT